MFIVSTILADTVMQTLSPLADVVVELYIYVILFTVRFLTNVPETLHYCLQYIRVTWK